MFTRDETQATLALAQARREHEARPSPEAFFIHHGLHNDVVQEWFDRWSDDEADHFGDIMHEADSQDDTLAKAAKQGQIRSVDLAAWIQVWLQLGFELGLALAEVRSWER